MSGVFSSMNWRKDEETLVSKSVSSAPKLFGAREINKNEIVFDSSEDGSDSGSSGESSDVFSEDSRIQSSEETKITNSLLNELLLKNNLNSDIEKIRKMIGRKYEKKDESKICCSNEFCSKDKFCSAIQIPKSITTTTGIIIITYYIMLSLHLKAHNPCMILSMIFLKLKKYQAMVRLL